MVFVGITGLCSPKRGWWIGKYWWNEKNFLLVEKTSIRLQYAVTHRPNETGHMFVRIACM